MATCQAYIQVVPEFSTNYLGDKTRVRKIKPVRLTAGPPRDPLGGTITVKLNLDIDDAAFLPLEPEATVAITAPDVEVNVEVETPEAA